MKIEIHISADSIIDIAGDRPVEKVRPVVMAVNDIFNQQLNNEHINSIETIDATDENVRSEIYDEISFLEQFRLNDIEKAMIIRNNKLKKEEVVSIIEQTETILRQSIEWLKTSSDDNAWYQAMMEYNQKARMISEEG